MATYYSDNYSSQNTDDTIGAAVREVGYFAPPGAGHGRMRMKRMGVNVPDQMAANDKLIMGSFKSNDRIFELWYAFDDLSAGAATIDIGIYKTGVDHNGVIVEGDKFEDGLSVASAVAWAEFFKGGTAALTDLDRGKALWELVGLTKDPVLQYDLVIKAATGPLDLGGSGLIVALYTSGD